MSSRLVKALVAMAVLGGLSFFHGPVFAASEAADTNSTLYWITFEPGTNLRQLKQKIQSQDATLVSLAPERKLLVRAPQTAAARLRGLDGVTDVAENISLAVRETLAAAEPEGQGMGAQRITAVQRENAESLLTAVESVEANDLGIARATLDGSSEPSVVDNSVSQYFPPIRSQGSQGSCTAWAAEYYYNTYTQAKDENLTVSDGNNNSICSPAFLYALENGGVDEGAITYESVARLTEVGGCSWTLMPYSQSDWLTWPSEAAWTNALRRRMQTAYVIGDLYENGCSETEFHAIKQRLANGDLVVTDTEVYSNWYNNYPNDTTGINNQVLFASSGSLEGGHALAIVGYDDGKTYYDGSSTKTGAFLIANSWGSSWGSTNTVGQHGYLWVAYDYFKTSNGCFGVAYYNSDRANYRPQLYAAAGINHAQRNRVILSGGVGRTNSATWSSYDPVHYDGGVSNSITSANRMAVDLTDGVGYITNFSDVRLFVRLQVGNGASTSGTISNADFYYDFDGDGTYATASSTNPPVTVKANRTGYASVRFVAATLTNFGVIITNPAAATVTVEHSVADYALQGVAGTSVVGQLRWTNTLTGGSGTGVAATNWVLTDVALATGSNVITVVGTNNPWPGVTLGADSATNSSYADGWVDGGNDGSGMDAWSLSGSSNAGFFVSDPTVNTNLDIAEKAWGLWAFNDAVADATRPLNAPLAVHQRFTMKFENHWIDSSRSVGVGWQNSAGENLLEIYFVGGDTHYTINDATGAWLSSVAWTDHGFCLNLELTSTNAYRLTMGDTVVAGTLMSRTDRTIKQFHVWNYSAGSGSNGDFFVADIQIAAPMVAVCSTSDTVVITREAPPCYTLQIQSDHGSPEPPAGMYTNTCGTVLTNHVETPVTLDSTQYVCVGWTLVGNSPGDGMASTLTMTLTNDAVLTWLWQTNFYFAATAAANGSVSTTGGWVRAGSTAQVTAAAAAYYHFTNWGGDVSIESQFMNPLDILVEAPLAVTANFAENLTSHETPEWWLASYGLTNEYESAATNDFDGDGYSTWQEWILQTDPTNINSSLEVRSVPEPGGGYVVCWNPVTNRSYSIFWRTNLFEAPLLLMEGLVWPQASYTDVVHDGQSCIYYRVRVTK